MRSFTFILALIAISSVVTLKTNLHAKISNNAQLKSQYDKLQKTNMGSIIFNLAQLHEQGGRFDVLFDAIDDLSKFLGSQLSTENANYAEDTNNWQQNVARLTKSSLDAQTLYETDNSNLSGSYYPNRDNLVNLISNLNAQLEQAKQNLGTLESNRVQQVADYNAAKADYQEGIASIKQAQPLLNSLLNDQSFLQVNKEQFVVTYSDMKQKLGKLKYGIIYTSFVQTLEMMLTNQHFANQQALQTVVEALDNLLKRLEDGVNSLDVDESQNLKTYNDSHQALVDLIQATEDSLTLNHSNLDAQLKQISETEAHRDLNVAAYTADQSELTLRNADHDHRQKSHDDLVSEIGKEQATIDQATQVLNKAGVSRDS